MSNETQTIPMLGRRPNQSNENVYTTPTGVKIGKEYTPPRRSYVADETIWLQSAMIGAGLPMHRNRSDIKNTIRVIVAAAILCATVLIYKGVI